MLENKNSKHSFNKSRNNETSGPRFTTLSLVVICLYILFFRTDYLNDISLFLIRIGIITSILALISRNFCKKKSIYLGFFLTIFVGLNFIVTMPLLIPSLWPTVGSSSLVYIDNLFFFFAAFLALTYTTYELWIKEDTGLLCKVYILNPISLFVGLFCSVSFIFGQELAAWLFLINNLIISFVLFRKAILDKKRSRFNFSLLVMGLSVIVGIIIRFIPEMKTVHGIESTIIVLFVIMIILNLFFDSVSEKRSALKKRVNLNENKLEKENSNLTEKDEEINSEIDQNKVDSLEKTDSKIIASVVEKTNDVITISKIEEPGVLNEEILETKGIAQDSSLNGVEKEKDTSKGIDIV